MFSQYAIALLVGAALLFTTVSAVALLGLLVRDYRNGKLW